MPAVVSEKLQDLYGDYYASSGLSKKRQLSAAESFGFVRQLVGSETFNSVVDVGAGQGSLVELFSRTQFAKQITALEISASGLEAIASRDLPNVSIVPFDGYNSAFADKTFDLAISSHVLEHVEHERLFLHEIKRIARRAIIEVPLEHTFDLAKRVRATDQFGHINHYTTDTFERLLTTSGLKPVKVITSTYTLDLDTFLYGRVKGTLKNYVRGGALNLWPSAAKGFFVYLCAALCDC